MKPTVENILAHKFLIITYQSGESKIVVVDKWQPEDILLYLISSLDVIRGIDFYGEDEHANNFMSNNSEYLYKGEEYE